MDMPHTDAGFKGDVMVVRMVTVTDVGLQRKNNEDACTTVEDVGLCIVADGMGGHLGGEIASNIAIEAMTEAFQDHPRGEIDERQVAELLTTSIKGANKEIYRRGNADIALKNMGTTVVAAVFNGKTIVTACVGDSRIYRLRDSKLEQITEDHSWVGELRKKNLISEADARSHPLKNIITRALGMEPGVEVDVKWDKIEPGDIYLLCTDGLTDLVTDSDIKARLNNPGADLDTLAKSLIELANDAGGTDNITIGICQVE
jgi:PPM family protein phosphatase